MSLSEGWQSEEWRGQSRFKISLIFKNCFRIAGPRVPVLETRRCSAGVKGWPVLYCRAAWAARAPGVQARPLTSPTLAVPPDGDGRVVAQAGSPATPLAPLRLGLWAAPHSPFQIRCVVIPPVIFTLVLFFFFFFGKAISLNTILLYLGFRFYLLLWGRPYSTL